MSVSLTTCFSSEGGYGGFNMLGPGSSTISMRDLVGVGVASLEEVRHYRGGL